VFDSFAFLTFLGVVTLVGTFLSETPLSPYNINAPGSPPERKAAWLRTKPWFLRAGVGMVLVGAVGLLANWIAG